MRRQECRGAYGVIAYFNGSFVCKEEIHVSPDDRGFLFAAGLSEVVRSYGGRPFKMAEHRVRLARNLRETRIDFTRVVDLAVAEAQLIARNGLETEGSILYFQVTRGVVLDLCRHCGIASKEQDFRVDELNRASEIIITDTNKEITPVVRLDGRSVGTGIPVPVTRRLQAAYSALVRGKESSCTKGVLFQDG